MSSAFGNLIRSKEQVELRREPSCPNPKDLADWKVVWRSVALILIRQVAAAVSSTHTRILLPNLASESQQTPGQKQSVDLAASNGCSDQGLFSRLTPGISLQPMQLFGGKPRPKLHHEVPAAN